MTEQDLELVLHWRNTPRIRNISNSNDEIDAKNHRDWFAKLQKDSSAKAWIFEEGSRPLGFVLFNHINSQKGSARWGFYLGEEDLPRGTGSAMANLALDWAFRGLNLKTVLAECLSTNERGLKFHASRGFIDTGLKTIVERKDQSSIEVHQLILTKEAWEKKKH